MQQRSVCVLAFTAALGAACHRPPATSPAAPGTSPAAPVAMPIAPMPSPLPANNGPAASVNLTGTWSSVFGGGTGAGGSTLVMTIAQNGASVTGSYQGAPGTRVRVASGTLNGTVAGSTVTGTWSDSEGYTGPFTWTVAPDGRGFVGAWHSNTLGGPWNGTKQ